MSMQHGSAVGRYKIRDKFPGKEFSGRDRQRLAAQISRLLNQTDARSGEN